MAYQVITSDKEGWISSGTGSEIIYYLAGNMNTQTNSITGNAKNASITVSTNVSWATAELVEKDDTAYNIKVSYERNNTGSMRLCILKLSNNNAKEFAYTINLAQMSDSYDYIITWNLKFIDQNFIGGNVKVILYAYLKTTNLYSSNDNLWCELNNRNCEYTSFGNSNGNLIPLTKQFSYINAFNNMFPVGTYNIPDHNYDVSYEILEDSYAYNGVNIDIDDTYITFYNYMVYGRDNGASTPTDVIINVRNSNIVITDDTITINLNYIADNWIIED